MEVVGGDPRVDALLLARQDSHAGSLRELERVDTGVRHDGAGQLEQGLHGGA